MAQANLLFGQAEAKGTAAIPHPPRFADFKFTTIGQQPELLKRISAPDPDYQYHDPSSPEPSIDQDHSVHSTPKALSRPTLLEVLAAHPSDVQDTIMQDSTDDMTVDTQPVGTLFQSNDTSRGVATRLDPLLNQSGGTSISSSNSGQNPSPTRVPVAKTPQSATETSTHTPTQESISPDSPYIVLRTLQSRLLSSLSSLKPPQMDISNTLHLVQAANSHSADALSAAHRANTLSQQALDVARDAAAVSQECLAAAEQAKAHATAAVSAVEQMVNSDSGVLKNNWEWKSVIDDLRDGLSAMGQWVSERESEEAARRHKLEVAEKERKHRESVESAMRMTSGSLPAPRTTSTEVSWSPTSTGTPTMSFGTSVQTSGVDAHSPIGPRASAEAEAVAARSAWGLEHINSTNTPTIANSTTSTLQEHLETAEEKRRVVIATSLPDVEERNRRQVAQKQREQEREREQQKQKEGEAEIRRAQDLERQKLEVANFHTQERERQERLQKEEAARRAAEADRLQKEAELLEEQRRKDKALEAAKADEARARMEKARAERLEQIRANKQKAEEAAKEQAKLDEQKRELAARAQEQANLLEKKRAEETAVKQAAELKVREEEARKVAEAKAAEDAVNAAAKRASEETQALELQNCREIKEKKMKLRQELLFHEAEEQRLREEQEKKRQEVMANKQRAIASARIHAQRAQKEREKNAVISATPPELNTPRVSVFTPHTPSTSQSPLTHTQPLPSQQQSPTAHIGNLTAKKTVAPSSGDASRSRRVLSGGVKLGVADEAQSRPESPTPSSLTACSAALEFRDKIPPIPKRSNKLNAQQLESSISPAERLSMTQPTVDTCSSLPAIPGSNSHADVSIATPSDIRYSGRVTPNGKPIAGGGHRTPTPVTPVTPSLTICGDGKHPLDNNNRSIPEPVSEPVPEPVSVHRRGHHTGNLCVIPQSKATQPSPQAQAANLRFVKDEAGVLWNTYLKADPDMQAKVELHEDDVFSDAQVKKESGTPSSVISKRSFDADTEPSHAAPLPVVPPVSVSVTSSSTAHRPNLAALAPQPRAVSSTVPHSVESRTPATSTSTSNVANPTLPVKPKLPSFKKLKHIMPDTIQPGFDDDTSNLSATNKRLNSSIANAPPPNDVSMSVPKQAIQPMPATMSSSAMAASAMSSDSRNHSRDPTMLFEDSSVIAPVMGDGGWDSWDGTPPRFSHNSSTHSQVSSWPDSELARDSGHRKSVPRWGDHNLPPSSRQPLPANSNRYPEHAPSVQDQRPARPIRPRDHTPPPNPSLIIPPKSFPMERRPNVLGKRHCRDDDNIQGQQNRPVRRQRPEPQLEMEDQVYRSELARPTSPLERRPPASERSNGLQSRIGQREVGRWTADVYRPVYRSDHYRPAATPATAPTQPRSHSYQSTYTPEQSYPDYPATSTRDSYRPDLLERMEATSSNTFNSHHGRGKPPVAGNGTFRGRRGRGASAVGNRPLEQRISTSYNNNEHLSLARRLESPPPRHGPRH